MARAPGIIDKVNAVLKYFENPCDAPWTIYFETALPALGEAIITVLSFGFDDVVRGALRPGGLRSGRHFRGRKGGGGLGRAIPEVGEMLGAMLPGAKAAKQRSVTQGVKNLWLLDGVIQRALWYWLVADVTATFAFEWTSAINESRFCQAQGVGAALSKDHGGVVCFSTANAWTTPPIEQIVYQTGFAGARFGAHTNNGLPFNAVTELSGVPVPPLPFGSIEMRVFSGPGQGDVIQGTLDAEGNQTVMDSRESNGEPLIYQYRTNGGTLACTGTSFTMGL